MSHRDTVEGSRRISSVRETDTCSIAAVADDARRLYGVQFHPEVVHTQEAGRS